MRLVGVYGFLHGGLCGGLPGGLGCGVCSGRFCGFVAGLAYQVLWGAVLLGELDVGICEGLEGSRGGSCGLWGVLTGLLVDVDCGCGF